MNTEDRLRTALHAAADDTEVDPASFDRIERRTASARRRRRAVGGGLAVVALVAVAIGVPLALRDGGESVQVGPASDTRETTTTTSTTTEPAPAPTEEHAFQWPAPGDDRTFGDPQAAVQAFAEEYLGVVGPFVVDNGNSTFTVRPQREGGGPTPADGPRTVVEVTTVDGHFAVTGATSPNIEVDTPAFSEEVSSPVRVSGRARNLFEANVIVDVRSETSPTPLATEATTAAGSGPELAPYTLDLSFEEPGVGRGAIVVRSDSGIEGTPEATVVPVLFGTDTAGRTREVTVFLQDPQGDFLPVQRTIPFTSGVLRASLEQLLRGTTADDEARGFSSPFSENGDLLRGVTIAEDGTAVVDLDPGIVDELAGADGAAVLASLDRTVFQFPTVTWVRYSVGGGCADFAGIGTDLLCERRSRDEY
jgi:hypothetical protein